MTAFGALLLVISLLWCESQLNHRNVLALTYTALNHTNTENKEFWYIGKTLDSLFSWPVLFFFFLRTTSDSKSTFLFSSSDFNLFTHPADYGALIGGMALCREPGQRTCCTHPGSQAPCQHRV